MKKSLYGLLIIIISFITINVHAEELFKYEFTTEKNKVVTSYGGTPQTFQMPFSITSNTYTTSYDNEIMTANNVISYRNGYLGIDLISDKGTKLTYYNASGVIVNSKLINNYYIITGSITGGIIPKRYLFDLIVENNNKLYLIAYSLTDDKEVTLVINENLEVEKRIENKIVLSKSNNKLYVVDIDKLFDLSNLEKNINNILFTTDFDLNTYTPINIEKIVQELQAGNTSIFNDIADLIEDILPNYKWIVPLVKDDIIKLLSNTNMSEEELNSIVSKNPILNLISSGKQFVDITDKYIVVIDKDTENIQIINTNGEMIYNKSINYDNLEGIQMIHDYLMMIKSDGCEYSSIEIYDLNGTLVQTIKKESSNNSCLTSMYRSIKETKAGFSVLSLSVDEIIRPSRSVSYSDFDYYNDVYSLPQDIKITIIGNGNISVPSQARFGETITFTVEKQAGYTLKMVRAYDDQGNELEVKNNSFVMPNGSVTLQAEFVEELKENPKTGQMGSLIFIALIIALGITLKLKNKKLTTLKNI